MAKKKDKKVKRRILKAKISHLSLCPRGMNQIQTMYKADDGVDHNISLATIVKEGMTEQGEILAVVYAPEMIDGEGDIASAAVIKEMAYDFSANGQGIDIRHNEQTLEVKDAYIAESFIIQKGDPRFANTKDYDGNEVDVTGGWGTVLKVNDEGLRKDYREGKWGGISMGGLMLAKPEEPVTKLFKKLERFLSTKSKKEKSENTMALTKEDKIEIAELVKSTMADTNKEAMEKAKKEADDKKAKGDEKKLGMGYVQPILKSNPTEEEVDKHRRCLEIYELSKSVNSGDSRAVFDFMEKSKEIAQSEDLNAALAKQQSTSYETFFTSNQDATSAKKAQGNSDDPMGDAILADIEKEEKADAA